MKIEIRENLINESAERFLQRNGYAHIYSRHTGHDSYVRRLSRDHYPRLHVYIKRQGAVVIFDMHLDQKKTSYQGAHAHNAEYDGPVVEGEINRLKDLLGAVTSSLETKRGAQAGSASFSAPTGIGHGKYAQNIKPRPKLSWWRRIFS